MASHDNLPYWQVNVPEHKRAAQCPVYLLGISDKDRDIISTPDSEYTPQTWDQVSSFVKLNNLELFQRWPSELRRYRAYMHKIKTTYGSVTRFILNERLQWETPVVPYGSPFEFKDDVKILYNDWPYGIDPRIVHLVVWTKFCIDEDPVTGDLTDRAREQVDTFVTRTFQSQVSPENVIWFKNWAALKSVDSVEHFHVMLMDPSPKFVEAVTNGDVPSCNKFDS